MNPESTHIIDKLRENQIITSNDKRLAMQFRTRKEALDSAKLIRWPSKSPIRIEIMGFYVWALADDHMRYVTRVGYSYLRAQIAKLSGREVAASRP